MRILQLCHKPPYPPIDGGSIASYNLATGLIENGCQVNILAMNTFKQFCDIDKVPQDFKDKTEYQLVFVDIRLRIADALLNLFTSQSYNISRFDSKNFRDALSAKLNTNNYDCVLLDSLFTSPYIDTIRSLHKGLIILRCHNVEYNIWKNLATHETNPFKRWYLSLLSKRLKKHELSAIDKVDGIAAISNSDIMVFKNQGCQTSMHYVPFGINFDKEPFNHTNETPIHQPVLFHVGSMDWIPHQEAIRWFLENVWIKLNKLYPNIQLHLAGANMPQWIIESDYPNTYVTKGFVDGKSFMKDKAIMIVPSFSGSGIRVKIIEGMALGKVIITTANGAMGIPYTNNENIFVTDNAEEWIAILCRCFENKTILPKVSSAATQFCRETFDYKLVAADFIEVIIAKF